MTCGSCWPCHVLPVVVDVRPVAAMVVAPLPAARGRLRAVVVARVRGPGTDAALRLCGGRRCSLVAGPAHLRGGHSTPNPESYRPCSGRVSRARWVIRDAPKRRRSPDRRRARPPRKSPARCDDPGGGVIPGGHAHGCTRRQSPQHPRSRRTNRRSGRCDVLGEPVEDGRRVDAVIERREPTAQLTVEAQSVPSGVDRHDRVRAVAEDRSAGIAATALARSWGWP